MSEDNAPLPDLESLRCFTAAATHLNFRKAAQSVHLSPAAFGERIRQLEENFGAQLFTRTTRKVELTAAGHRTLPQARRCLQEAQQCKNIALDENLLLPYRITLGTRYELGLSWIVSSLPVLQKQTPERTIDLIFGDSQDLLAHLNAGRIDALVSSTRLMLSDLAYANLHEERYVFVGATKLLEKKPLTQRKHAAQHTLIDAHPDLPLFRYLLDATRGASVWGFASRELMGTIAAIRQRVLQGVGVAVLPLYFVEKDLERGVLVQLMPKVRLATDYFRLIWRADHVLGPQFQQLAQELQQIPLK